MSTEMTPKIIELSISKNYVCTWGFWEAMREIFQNAIDADNKGYRMELTMSGYSKDLYVSNHNTILPINSLVLGNSTKGEESIGKYGEGYKLALVVLLRLGYKVQILVGYDIWQPYFDYSETLQTEVLKIKIEVGQNKLFTDCTTFVISGISSYDVENLYEKCIPFKQAFKKSIGRTIDSEYGQILLDDAYKGKFFVEGLYIQDDDSFKYGYSFKNEYVDLDRDRRAINYYDLLSLTTNSLLTQTEDITIVETCITNKEKDIRDLDEFYKTIPHDFAVGFAQHFMDKYDLDEDTFVGTEKETMVSGSAKTFVTDKIQARIVNQGLGLSTEYREVQTRAKQRDNRDISWDYYNKSELFQLHSWLCTNCRNLSNKQINAFLSIIKTIKPTGYELIKDDINESLYAELITRTNNKFKGDI